MDFTEHDDPLMVVPSDFDYTVASADFYTSFEPRPFVGKYGEIRAKLDCEYHHYYDEHRQLVHDKIIERFLNSVIIVDGDTTCDVPLKNWIVFTAGPMGAGKGYTLNWMKRNGYFPLDAFVRVDPDEIRNMLPEMPGYMTSNQLYAGSLTQRESGYIAETLGNVALNQRKNVLVDGSLRNTKWYRHHLLELQVKYPETNLAIVSVIASYESIKERCERRALLTGRQVHLTFFFIYAVLHVSCFHLIDTRMIADSDSRATYDFVLTL